VFAADPTYQTDALCQSDIKKAVLGGSCSSEADCASINFATCDGQSKCSCKAGYAQNLNICENKCKDGLIHGNTCVFAKFGKFNYDASQAYCQSMGGYLAYIDSEETYTAVDKYLRTAQQTVGKNHDYWWGATYKNREVVLNNGNRPKWLKWQPPHPLNEPQRTAMIMAVVQNSNSKSNGVFAADPTYQTDALCQSDI